VSPSAPPLPAPSATAPLPLRTKLTWALGSLGDNYAGNTINQLKDPVYTVALGVPPEYVGWALSLPRFLDAFFDPVVGFWSDRARTRWGRRRPFILAGAAGLALGMTLLWMPPAHRGWSHLALAGYFLAASTLFYAAYSLFLVPYRALGLELTGDYHDRTRLQGWGMIVGLVGGLGLPWLYKLALVLGGTGDSASVSAPAAATILAGAQAVGLGVAALILVTCLVPALGCRETPRAPTPPIPLRHALAATLRNRPFLGMLGMNLCALVGLYSTVTLALLLAIFHLFAGDQEAAATLTGVVGMCQMLGSLAGVPVLTALSGRHGKRAAALLALAIGAVGFGSLWFTLQPAHPYWAAGSYVLIGWGMQGVWLMSATMNADVCDHDELATGQRREGIYGAVFALEQRIGLGVAALLGGYLVTHCGYRPDTPPTPATLAHLRLALVATPLLGLAAAAVCIARYPLSRDRVHAIQAELSRRRAARGSA
jgi:GPH family glycoside/pentoside/hexuronide:cation symporter